MYYNTISQRYKHAFDILKTLPLTLFGATVLTLALSAYAFRSVILWIFPIAAIPVALLLSAGAAGVYLKAARQEKYDIMHLFDVFKDWQTIKRIIVGMLWMLLKVYLWSIIPALVLTLAGVIMTFILSFIFDTRFFLMFFIVILIFLWTAASVIALIKSIEYSFTVYILISRPEINATDAVKEASRLTKGFRLRIFGAMILPSCIYSAVIWALTGMSFIPFIGWIFGAAAVVVNIVFAVAVSAFLGLVMAGFYTDALNPPPPPTYEQYQQQYYNAQYTQAYQQSAPQPEPAPASEAPTQSPTDIGAPSSDDNAE